LATKTKAPKRTKPKTRTGDASRQAKPARGPALSRALAKKVRAFDPSTIGGAEVLDRFWTLIERRRSVNYLTTSHSARLIARGTQRVAKKLGEEVVELIIEAVGSDRSATISEAADVFYHLMVLLVDSGIQPTEVWQELYRREGVSDIVEKAFGTPGKKLLVGAGTTKLP
jgi:phosphoribosyl-ATP pyrophosphohydrolase